MRNFYFENNEMEKTWTVVHFKDEDAVEAVPSSWILNNTCYWPPFSREKLLQYIKKNDEPNTCWPLYRIRSFHNSLHSDYLVAREKARKAESTSDLNTSDGGKRKITRKIYSSESSEDFDGESNLPNPPQFKETQLSVKETGNSVTPQRNGVSVLQKDMNCMCREHSEETVRLMKDMIRKQNIMQAFMKQMNDDLQDLKLTFQKRNEGDTGAEAASTSILINFNIPLKHSEDLESLKNYLLECNENFVAVVNELSKLGCSTLYDFIRRVLTLTLTNSLAEQFTWYGMKGKRVFKNLKLAEAIINASEIFSQTVTRKEVEENIRKWLRRAKERKQYRREKEYTD